MSASHGTQCRHARAPTCVRRMCVSLTLARAARVRVRPKGWRGVARGRARRNRNLGEHVRTEFGNGKEEAARSSGGRDVFCGVALKREGQYTRTPDYGASLAALFSAFVRMRFSVRADIILMRPPRHFEGGRRRRDGSKSGTCSVDVHAAAGWVGGGRKNRDCGHRLTGYMWLDTVSERSECRNGATRRILNCVFVAFPQKNCNTKGEKCSENNIIVSCMFHQVYFITSTPVHCPFIFKAQMPPLFPPHSM